MKDRQQMILLAIIDNFISTAIPVGSQTIVRQYSFDVSPATIRHEMFELEEQGLLCQPHTSAGRVPTAKGYKLFVKAQKNSLSDVKAAKKEFSVQLKQYHRDLAKERVYQSVELLARVVRNVSFATLPGNERTIFLGLSNVLRQPEFTSSPEVASQVVEVLEESFISVLKGLEIDKKIRTYIGQDDLIEQFQSCSMLVTAYKYKGEKGVVGILGPMRMRYNYNYAALEQAREMIEES
jgi:transcriptional regulator of heat shock response